MTNYEYKKARSEGETYFFRRDVQNEDAWERLDLSESGGSWVPAGLEFASLRLFEAFSDEIKKAIMSHQEPDAETPAGNPATPKYFAAPNSGTVYALDDYGMWRSLNLVSDGSFSWVPVPDNGPPERTEAITGPAVFRMIRENRKAAKKDTPVEEIARNTYAYFNGSDGNLYRLRPPSPLQVLKEYEPETRELWVDAPHAKAQLTPIDRTIDAELSARRTFRVTSRALRVGTDENSRFFADMAASFRDLVAKGPLNLFAPLPGDEDSVKRATAGNEAVNGLIEGAAHALEATAQAMVAAKTVVNDKDTKLAALKRQLDDAQRKVGSLTLQLEQKHELVEQLTDSLERARRAGFDD
jgi:hypothetical protein